ncbi:MAG: hypothetical protein UHK60_04405, partial [Acutalibacteraceae bacterium]|nr:hypothetical protein [Acutalibacteraceae bacterium]
MENKTDYTNLSIDEKLVLLDGKLNYLDKLIVHIEEKIDKLEKLESKLSETNIKPIEEVIENIPTTNTDSEPVAMGGSFGFGGNEPLDEEYTPVEKEPVVLDNIPLGGSFGFESEDTKVETVKEDIEEPATTTPVEAVVNEPVVEATVEDTNESTPVTNTNSEPVAMGGSFGFGGNEPIDEEYAPVEKEPVVLDNIPLGGSFGFESEDTKVETVKEDIEEPATTTPVEAVVNEPVVDDTPIEDTNESTPATNTDSEPVAMGGSFGFGGNEPLDEEYTPVEKEPVVLDNIPLGGSFGFESEDTKVETVKEDIAEPITETPVETAIDETVVEAT